MDIGLRKCPRVYVGSTKRSTSGLGTTRFLDTWRVALESTTVAVDLPAVAQFGVHLPYTRHALVSESLNRITSLMHFACLSLRRFPSFYGQI